MATYNTKYKASWGSSKGVGGYLYIKKRDYFPGVTPPTEIKLQDDAIDISNNFVDTESPVIGLRCEFFVTNNKDDYFELFELLTAYEKQFKVTVEVTQPAGQAMDIFEGFINVDAISHGYVNYQEMRLVASSYLSKLQYIEIDSVDTKQNMTFIDIIDEALRETGSEYDIRVNCNLHAFEDTLSSGKTLFNLNGVNTEAFWNNDVERMSALEIIEAILMPFNCFLYWWDGYWYIEHFTDIWQTSIDYVEYTTGTSYSPDDTGSVVNISREIKDVHDLVFRDLSQEVHVVPAVKTLSIKLNSSDSLLVNMIPRLPVQSTVTEQSNSRDITGADFPTGVQLREWTFLSDDTHPTEWENSGSQFKGIGNGVVRKRTTLSPEGGLLLASKFQCTVLTETEITVGFTYSDVGGELYNTAYGLDNKSTSDLSLFYMDFFFVIYYEVGGTRYFISYDQETDTWYVDSGSKINWPSKRAVRLKVEGTEFDKVVDGFKLSTTIPLGEVKSALSGGTDNYLVTEEITDFTFVLINEAMYKWIDYPALSFRTDKYDARDLPRVARYGDIHITSTNDLDYNLIEGILNAYFLDKKELEFFIGDNTNLNYTNGILRGSNLDKRTTEWTRPDSAFTEKPLIDIFFIEKFRMFNIPKQKIVSTIDQSTFLKPFTLFTESKQGGKKFILANYGFRPSMDQANVTLLEYDNDTEVTLTNGV